MADGHLRGIAKTWAKRTVATGLAAASVGKAAAKHAAATALDRVGDGIADAEAIALHLDELKGLSMKLGQMASVLDGIVPEHVQKALVKLQSASKPLEWDAIEPVLTEAYGKPPDAIFEAFERVPFAAASIGQVHAAKVDGRDVAVKVQYPGIAAAIDIDFGNITRFAFLQSLGTAMAPGPLREEMRDRLREECDYYQEAANQLLFREIWAHDPRVVVPDVVVPLVRREVLVSERIFARGFHQFVAEGTPAEHGAAGVLLFDHAMTSIFAQGLFNADPHPGNYLFLPDGRIAFLDYGCVRVFGAEFVDNWKALAKAVLAGDRAKFRSQCDAMGFVGGRKFDYDAQFDVVHYLYEPMLVPKFRFTPEYVRRSWDMLIWNNPNLRHTRMPPEWLLCHRLQWGLYAVLAKLDAEGDYATCFRAAIESPTLSPSRPAPLAPAG
jgi:predicted unusual protein kinase regulating ubiquinone biosynthesis (AarF/ABC1/UbiB family)